MWIMLNWKELIFVVFIFNNAMSLELTELKIPKHIPVGIRANLVCHWTLGPADVLYSVKWYKDGKEFYRHVPADVEPLKKFILPGVDVQESNSTASALTLAPATGETSGRYRCEVSGERPHFQTVSKYADMYVEVLPSHGLHILGFEVQYRVGDQVNVTCSTQSTPSLKLAWYINGESALNSSLHPHSENGETRLGMEFTVVKEMGRTLKLQCLATVGYKLWRSVVKYAVVTEFLKEKEINLLQENFVVFSTSTKSGQERITGLRFIALLFIVFCF